MTTLEAVVVGTARVAQPSPFVRLELQRVDVKLVERIQRITPDEAIQDLGGTLQKAMSRGMRGVRGTQQGFFMLPVSEEEYAGLGFPHIGQTLTIEVTTDG